MFVRIATVALALVVCAGVLLAQPAVNAASKKYTVNAEFALGNQFNVSTAVADQLQLVAGQVTTFPIMWIANAGEDSISKWDTNTNKELARYKTWISFNSGCTSDHCGSAYLGAAPSRTAVDSDGNVYVANRHFDGRNITVLKILANNFIDRNGNGTAQTSVDTNNDGLIQYPEMLVNTDLNNNGLLDPSEIADERVAWIATIPNTAGGLGRSLSIDNNGDIWVGAFNLGQYFKLRGSDGAVLGGPYSTPGHTPYGSLVDAAGTLWGAALDSASLLKFNTATQAKQVFPHGNLGGSYGIAIGNSLGGVPQIYLGSYNGGGGYIKFDTSLNTFSFPGTLNVISHGIATDGNGNILICNRNTGGMTKFSAAGAVLWNAPNQSCFCWGAVVDSNQDGWVISRDDSCIAKYRGTDGASLGRFPAGSNPYTYSDATGIQRFASQREGQFTVKQDSGLAANVWTSIQWNTEPQGAVPANTTLTVQARTAANEAALATATFQPVTSGAAACLSGQFIEVRTTFRSTDQVATPVLSDIAVRGRCDVNSDGLVNSVDIQLITAGRNSPASGPCDPRDADGNLTINVNDSRQCALRCSKPNCGI